MDTIDTLKAQRDELLAALKNAIEYIEHSHANAGRLTTDEQWDANVADFRKSRPSEISISRSYVPKATLYLESHMKLIAKCEEQS